MYSYLAAEDRSRPERKFTSIWRAWVEPKVSSCAWRILHKSLPTKSFLVRRGILNEAMCSLCGEEETLDHALWKCKRAKFTWAAASLLLKKKLWTTEQAWTSWVSTLPKKKSIHQQCLLSVSLFALHCIWTWRNKETMSAEIINRHWWWSNTCTRIQQCIASRLPSKTVKIENGSLEVK